MGMPGGPPVAKKNNAALPIVVLLVIAAVGIGAFIYLSGSDDGGGTATGDGPEGVVEAYFAATVDQDCGAMADLVDMSGAGMSRDEMVQNCEQFAGVGGVGGSGSDDFPEELISTSVSEESENEATVAVEYRTRGGDTETLDLEVVNSGDGWRVDGASVIGSGGTSMTTPPGPDDTSGGGPDDTSGGSGGPDGSAPSLGSPTSPPLDDPDAQAEIADDTEDLATYANDCYGGDMEACDELWLSTDIGGVLEEYGATCGGRLSGTDYANDCAVTFGATVPGGGSGGGGSATSPPLDDPDAQAEIAADSEDLAAYANSCYDGDMEACDDLYWSTDVGGVLEDYGRSCGGRDTSRNIGGDCVEDYG